MVTLRRERMYEFLEKLVRVALPRIRDFKGIESKFDGRGNYTLGIEEQIIFPEINIDSIDRIQGYEHYIRYISQYWWRRFCSIESIRSSVQNAKTIKIWQKSMKAREVKRAKLVARYAEKRAALKKVIALLLKTQLRLTGCS